LARFLWQPSQTTAFGLLVVICAKTLFKFASRQFDGCGAGIPWQTEQAIPDVPPEKSAAWQIWQEVNPLVPVGVAFAVGP
jgi:hypothetical protein